MDFTVVKIFCASQLGRSIQGFTEVSQFCRPDLALVRQLFLQLGTNQIQNRLEDVLTDQVPEALQDAARGLLRNLFQNR